MPKRTIYSCDWCLVDAKNANEVDGDWKQVEHAEKNGVSHWLCSACYAAWLKAVKAARASRAPVADK